MSLPNHLQRVARGGCTPEFNAKCDCSSPAAQCHATPTSRRPRHSPPTSMYTRPLPDGLVDFSSAEGRTRLARALAAGSASAFCPLVAQLQTQAFPAACGLTTLAIVLNALRVDPGRVWHTPWRWYDESFLFCCSGEERVRAAGVTMDELACVARCHGLRAEVVRGASDSHVRRMAARLLAAEADEGEDVSFLAVAFSRRVLGQTGSGHFSPIAAYDEETDSVLVLDTARFKYPPFWVSLPELNAATLEVDEMSSLPRGFVVLTKPGTACQKVSPILSLSRSLHDLELALAGRREKAWSAEELVNLVLQTVGFDVVDCFFRGQDYFSVARRGTLDEMCIRSSIKETPVGRYLGSVRNEISGDAEHQALFVFGCLATFPEHGLCADQLALSALGCLWASMPTQLHCAITQLASALQSAIDGIQGTRADEVEDSDSIE